MSGPLSFWLCGHRVRDLHDGGDAAADEHARVRRAGLVAGSCAVKIPGVNALVSASDTFFIASAMLFGPAPAMVALALDSAALAWRACYDVRAFCSTRRSRRSRSVSRMGVSAAGGSPLDYSTTSAPRFCR
jgi:hypothetical protein